MRVRVRAALALVAWFAQLCLPLAHAVVMAAPNTATVWCGEPSRALAAAAALPPEIREALGLDHAGADHLDTCAKLCGTGSTAATTSVATTVVLRAADCESVTAVPPTPHPREQAPTPPSQGPPAHA